VRKLEFPSILRLSGSLVRDVEKLKGGFMKKSLYNRVQELIAWSHLFYFDNPKKAREHATYCIEQSLCSKMNYLPYYILGMSYVFENPHQAINYFSKAQSVQPELADRIDETDIAFTKILWGIDLANVKKTDISERAHFEAMWGDKKKATELTELALEQQGVTPFKLYYHGLATENDDILFTSLAKFLNAGNKFFANLPRRVLEGNEKYEKAVKILFENFNVA